MVKVRREVRDAALPAYGRVATQPDAKLLQLIGPHVTSILGKLLIMSFEVSAALDRLCSSLGRCQVCRNVGGMGGCP